MPAPALASGITLGRFGGIHGHANADGGLALYWNPALMSVEPGWVVTVDANVIHRHAVYEREVLDTNVDRDTPGVLEHNTGRATTTTVGALPYLALGGVQDFGSVRVSLFAGFYPGYGGTVEWDKTLGATAEHPGAIDGPQRWSAIASTLYAFHYAGGASITLPDLGLGFGFSLSYVSGSLETTRARNVTGSERLVDPEGTLQEGRVWLSATDTAWNVSIGGSYESDRVRLSGSYRAPYQLHLTGPLTQAFATQPPGPVDSYDDINLPHVILTAVTITWPRAHVTLASDFSTWSRMEDTDLMSNAEQPELLLHMPRNLENTLSGRVVAGGEIAPNVDLSGMFGLDPSAVPAETNEPGLGDAFKFQLGLGVRWQASERVRLMASYTEDIYTRVKVEESIQEPPANGTYHEGRRWLDLSFEGRF